MAKYNYETLNESYTKHKTNSDAFCDNIHQFSTYITDFINIDESDFTTKLAVNSKLYLQEVVIGAMEAMLIGMERYTSLFSNLCKSAEQTIDPGDIVGGNTNITTEGLILASNNNWSEVASKLDTMRTGMNELIAELNKLCGTTKEYEYTDIQNVYDSIYTKLDSVNIAMTEFSNNEDNRKAITDLGLLYKDIRDFVNLIGDCVVQGKIDYEEPDLIDKREWYVGYKGRAIDAITAMGGEYFANRPLKPMSAIELEGFRRILYFCMENNDGAGLENFFSPYDADRVLFYASTMFYLSETLKDYDSYEASQLFALGILFYYIADTTKGYENVNRIDIEIRGQNTVIFNGFSFDYEHSEDGHTYRQPGRKEDLDFTIGTPFSGESNNWLTDDLVDQAVADSKFNPDEEFYIFLSNAINGIVIGLATSPLPYGSGMLIDLGLNYDASNNEVQSRKDAQKRSLNLEKHKEASKIYDAFNVGVIVCKGEDGYKIIAIKITQRTRNIIDLINNDLPGTNLTEEDFYNNDGLTKAADALVDVENNYKVKLSAAGITDRDIQNEHWKDYLKSGGKYDYKSA